MRSLRILAVLILSFKNAARYASLTRLLRTFDSISSPARPNQKRSCACRPFDRWKYPHTPPHSVAPRFGARRFFRRPTPWRAARKDPPQKWVIRLPDATDLRWGIRVAPLSWRTMRHSAVVIPQSHIRPVDVEGIAEVAKIGDNKPH